MSIEAKLLESIGTVADNLGGTGFHASMLETFNRLIPGDEGQVYYYWPDGRSHYLCDIDTPKADCQAYVSKFSSQCPFFQYWRQARRPCVTWLDKALELESAGQDFTRYLSEFYSPLGLSDEIAMFMPTPTRRTIGLFLERQGFFSDDEKAALATIFPPLMRLHRANSRILLNSFAGPDSLSVTSRPVRFVDRSGECVFDNRPWRRFGQKRKLKLNRSISRMVETSANRLSVESGGVMTQYRLDEAFPLAPGGAVYVYETSHATASNNRASTDFLSTVLTPRERDIVGLVLDGHPIKTISDKLGISTNW